MLRGKKIMLSGATGMIGTCLVDLIMELNRIMHTEIRVIALSRNETLARKRLSAHWGDKLLTYKSCDINQLIPEMGNIDYVIHAASNTHPVQYANDPIGTITSNVIGTKNLLDYAVSHDVQRFCFLSSVEIYGENRGDVEAFHETYLGFLDCNTLRAGYPESKRVGETLCNAYRKLYDLDFCIPRLSRVYGPTMLQSDTKAISQFIKKALSGEDIVLKSEGKQKYSYTFVTDAVMGILYVLCYGEKGHAYNIADALSNITLRELAELLANLAHTNVIFELPDEKEQQGYSTATKALLDASALEEKGWRAKIHLEEGLKRTIMYFKN